MAERSLLAVMMLLAAATPARAQRPTHELGVHALVMARDPALAGGGIGAAVRTTSRTRFALTLTLASLDGDLAGRGELLGQFLLSPSRTAGAGMYAGGGVGLEIAEATRGVVIVLVGVEGRPGASSGWFVEAGVGGGLRVSAGWRWRRSGQLRS